MGCGLVFGHGIFLKGFSCKILYYLPHQMYNVFAPTRLQAMPFVVTFIISLFLLFFFLGWIAFRILMLSNLIFAGFYLQILWGYIGWSCPQCNPQWPKDHVDLQTGSQAQGTSRTHLCWEEIQRSPWEGTHSSQGTTFKKGKLEEEQHSLSSPLPVICKTFLVLLSLS